MARGFDKWRPGLASAFAAIFSMPMPIAKFGGRLGF
jgi:hypothetical protein